MLILSRISSMEKVDLSIRGDLRSECYSGILEKKNFSFSVRWSRFGLRWSSGSSMMPLSVGSGSS